MEHPYLETSKPETASPQYPFTSFLNGYRDFPLHWHYFIELAYFIEGEAQYYLDGEYHSMTSGDLVLVNSRQVHGLIVNKSYAKHIVIQFDPEILQLKNIMLEMKYVFPFTLGSGQQQCVFKREDLRDTNVPTLIREIHQEYLEKNYGYELAVHANINLLMLRILRQWKKQNDNLEQSHSFTDSDMKRFQKILEYTAANYTQEITVKEAAEMSNMSYTYFSKQFKKLMGRNFTEYVNYTRILEAERLLLDTDMNITQAAMETGFNNASYFIKQFRKFKSTSPKQFIKKYKNG